MVNRNHDEPFDATTEMAASRSRGEGVADFRSRCSQNPDKFDEWRLTERGAPVLKRYHFGTDKESSKTTYDSLSFIKIYR